jgi:inner membrane protein YidH
MSDPREASPDPPKSEASMDDASRRTWLAHERTLLAWWRTSFAAIAVALAVGRLLPSVLDVSATPFVILGVGFGLVAIALVVYGAVHHRAVQRDLQAGRAPRVDDRAFLAFTVVICLLLVGTTVLLALGK